MKMVKSVWKKHITSPHHGVILIIVNIYAAHKPGNRKVRLLTWQQHEWKRQTGSALSARHTHLPVSKEEEDVRSQPGLLYSRACRYAAKPLYLPSSFFLYFLFLVTHDLNAFP